MQRCIESTMYGKNLDYDYLLSLKDYAIKLGLKGIAFLEMMAVSK